MDRFLEIDMEERELIISNVAGKKIIYSYNS